jgi:hypothetical protein
VLRVEKGARVKVGEKRKGLRVEKRGRVNDGERAKVGKRGRGEEKREV